MVLAKKKAAPVAKGRFGRPAVPGKKVAAKKRPARKPLPAIAAPEGMRPQFVLAQIRTGKDGLFGPSKFVRYIGRFDFGADDKKKRDLATYDPQTATQIYGRLSATTFKATTNTMNPDPKVRTGVKGAMRLPPNTTFLVLIRATVKRADQTVAARIAKVFQVCKNKAGKAVPRELEKVDPAYRLIRRASRIMPPAFATVMEPPKLGRRKVVEEE